MSVGGHIELDEQPNEAAVREAKEESGLDVELVGELPNYPFEYPGFVHLIPPRYLNIHNAGDNHKHIGMIYFARTRNDHVNPTGDDVSAEWRWLTMEELDKNELGIKEPTLSYAKEALKELGG
jgi:8-oxo-dGTP pyrophosphatase MutT (NUDIX family)